MVLLHYSSKEDTEYDKRPQVRRHLPVLRVHHIASWSSSNNWCENWRFYKRSESNRLPRFCCIAQKGGRSCVTSRIPWWWHFACIRKSKIELQATISKVGAPYIIVCQCGTQQNCMFLSIRQAASYSLGEQWDSNWGGVRGPSEISTEAVTSSVDLIVWV